MLNTFTQMMAAVNDPVAIERGYQILSAKRDLIARQKEKTRDFAHTYMEPRPLVETRCPDMAELARVKAESAGSFKLMPSFDEACMTASTKGEWLLEMHSGTAAMHELGFIDGSHWRLLGTGYEYSSVANVKNGRKARIRNKYLKSVFVPA